MNPNTNNLVYIISQLQGELDETKKKLLRETEEKEKALIRLSSVAGSKLKYNNPGITDLSDQNRPQKLGEKFNELYDNEWTDALEIISNNLEEERAVHFLRQLLKEIYERTKVATERQYKNLQDALFQRDLRNSEARDFMEIYKKISELQKEVSAFSIKNIKKALREDSAFIKEYEMLFFCCETYIDRCVELCWVMNIQDPPMFLDFASSSESVDRDAFKLFTRNGDRVDFIVWPAVLLHENGPVVQKGVVQPLKSKQSRNKRAS